MADDKSILHRNTFVTDYQACLVSMYKPKACGLVDWWIGGLEGLLSTSEVSKNRNWLTVIISIPELPVLPVCFLSVNK